MKTCLVLVTHNRLNYTVKCLERILNDVESEYDLHIWDNASSDNTPAYLRSLRDNRIKEIVLSEKNAGQTVAMNRIWSATCAEFVAKLDNDCLITPGWLKQLTEVHRDCDKLGAIACWHFRAEDFHVNAATRHKIRECNGHNIFQHPWVCGSGFVMKRRTYLEMGPWKEGSPDIGTTDYFLKMALRGYTNGWLSPLILQHHMDDLFSPYRRYQDDKSLQDGKAITFSLRNNNINTIEDLAHRRESVLSVLLCGSPHARDYVGWRGRLKRHLPLLDRWRRTLLDFVPRPSRH